MRSMACARWAAVVALPLAALVTGCTSNGDGRSSGDLFDFGGLTGSGSSDRVAFRCDDDRSFRVNYNDDGNEAVVDAGDATYRLELRDSDGGRRLYEGERAELSVDGDDARLRLSGDDDYTDCKEA